MTSKILDLSQLSCDFRFCLSKSRIFQLPAENELIAGLPGWISVVASRNSGHTWYSLGVT